MMKIGIICGGVRRESESERISMVFSSLIESSFPGIEVEHFFLSKLSIPLWTEEKWEANSEISRYWLPISQKLKACDGFIVVCPEWDGMATPHLKNFLLMCDGGELAHKPALLAGVSSGMGGAYPVAELRMSGYKNSFIWWLPDHLIFRNVRSLFQVMSEPNEVDSSLVNRMKYCLSFLIESANMCGVVRERCQDLYKYAYGM